MSEKYGWVNALRGYAIVLVMLIHASQTFTVSHFTTIICNRGDLGVQLFFILSSFTLFNSYSKRKIEEGITVNRNFFIRRFFRIAPYYYVAGFIYVIYRLFFKNQSVSVENLISNYTFTNGIYLPGINDIPPGGWSIGVEMLFYLMIPLLFKYINSLQKALVLLLVTMLISIIINHYFLSYTIYYLSLIWDNIPSWSFYFWLPNQLPIFILGIILYFIKRNIIFSFHSGQILLISAIVLFIVFSFYEFRLMYPYYFIKREYVYGLIFVCFAIGVYTTKNKLIINGFIQKIGIVSFSMYLNHFLILYFLGYLYSGICKFSVVYLHLSEIILRNDFVFLGFYILLILITYSISKYTYRCVEIKGIELGDQFIRKLNCKI